MRFKLALAAGAVLVIGAAGFASARQDAPAYKGYLPPGAIDTLKILPPAPKEGETRYEADRKVFLATRALKDSPRWSLAQNDDDSGKIVADFGCAMGFTPDPEKLPKLTALLMKVRYDVGAATNTPKDFYGRKRPYLIDEGPICIAKTEGLAKSPDYPSGHTTWGWTVGLILAEADSAHATDILVRARSYGESRVICGVHNASAIEAGRTNASALVATLHGSAAFRADLDGVRADLDGVRAEIAAAREGVASPAQCDVEAALIAKTPY